MIIIIHMYIYIYVYIHMYIYIYICSITTIIINIMRPSNDSQLSAALETENMLLETRRC